MQKQRKSNFSKSVLFLALPILFAAFILSINTEAAAKKVITLQPEKTYTSYDVNGDGKKDTIRITSQVLETSPSQSILTIDINNKTVLTTNKPDASYEVLLCRLNKKTSYFSITAAGSKGQQLSHKLYQYKNKKLKTALNAKAFLKDKQVKNLTTRIKKVTNNKITISWKGTSKSAGKVSGNVSFKPGKNKLIQK